MNRRLLSVAAALLLIASPALAAPGPEPVVRRFLADYQAMRLDAILAASAPDTVMAMPYAPGGRLQLQGAAAIGGYLKQVFAQYRSIVLHDVVLTLAANGADVTVEAIADFTTPAGVRHSVGYVWILTVVGGRITSSRAYLMPLAPA
ncbi:MAG: hypothetical protein RL490_485 [Pseudomonadota bacterium]|jgi:ketosteroid isomerase-like protein